MIPKHTKLCAINFAHLKLWTMDLNLRKTNIEIKRKGTMGAVCRQEYNNLRFQVFALPCERKT